MKNFATAEYITPIIEEFKSKYKLIENKKALKSLNAILLFKSRFGNEYKVIRTEPCFYYHGPAIKALYKEIDSWTEAAETEPGELHRWNISEKNRVQQATRKALIEKYFSRENGEMKNEKI